MDLWIEDEIAWIVDHGSSIVDCGLWIVDCGLWIVDCGLKIEDPWQVASPESASQAVSASYEPCLPPTIS
jgi:hypothetical protein